MGEFKSWLFEHKKCAAKLFYSCAQWVVWSIEKMSASVKPNKQFPLARVSGWSIYWGSRIVAPWPAYTSCTACLTTELGLRRSGLCLSLSPHPEKPSIKTWKVSLTEARWLFFQQNPVGNYRDNDLPKRAANNKNVLFQLFGPDWALPSQQGRH